MQTGSKLFQWQKYNDQNWTDPYARHMHSLQLSQVKQSIIQEKQTIFY